MGDIKFMPMTTQQKIRPQRQKLKKKKKVFKLIFSKNLFVQIRLIKITSSQGRQVVTFEKFSLAFYLQNKIKVKMRRGAVQQGFLLLKHSSEPTTKPQDE